MRALLFSAGFGTRLRPHTERVAKPAMSFLSLPLLAFPLAHLEHLKLKTLVINLHHLPETVVTAATSVTKGHAYDLVFSREDPLILDSGGGMDQAKQHLKGDGVFVTANADALLLMEACHLQEAVEFHKSQRALVTFVTCFKDGVGERLSGLWSDPSHRYLGFGTKAPVTGAEPSHYTGFAIFSERIFSYIPVAQPSHILKDACHKAKQAGESLLVYHVNEAEFLETGNATDFNKAQSYCCHQLMSSVDCYQKSYLLETLRRFRPGLDLSQKTVLQDFVGKIQPLSGQLD